MNPQWTQRLSAAVLLLAIGLPGLLFAPVFGFRPLLLPIAVVLVACFAVTEVCARFEALRPWRPVPALAAGLLALGELEFGPGLPDAAMLRGLLDGVTRSWQLTLQSTWPARPDAELVLFVPLAVLVAAVLGVELLRRPAVALVPGLAVAGLSQAYVALSGPAATVAGLAYAVVAGALFALTRRRGSRLVLVVPAALLAVAVAAGITFVDQGSRPALAIGHEAAPPPPLRIDDPLDDVVDRLTHPAAPVFSYTSTAPVDRWRTAVLDDFDGVTWRDGADYLRLGSTLGAATYHARITVPAGSGGPWLPSQAEPATVTGVAPLVDPRTGTLLLPGRQGTVGYELGWREPAIAPDDLLDAGIDAGGHPAGGVGQVPPGVAELAKTATGGLRPSFRAALVLERYLAEHYHQAVGPVLPTGSGWAQLRTFLFGTRAGTSEQFAAAYAALARIVGIPARIAVGFRAPAGASPVTVHNGDAFAWPEVAVAGVGWVPLDPTGSATRGTGAVPGGLAQATDGARQALPPRPQLRDPQVGGDDEAVPVTSDPEDNRLLVVAAWVGFGLVALLLLSAASIPALRALRTARRRRRTGADAVVAAWLEARDVLRAHGIAVPRGATVRDLARLVPSTVDGSVAEALAWLARQVDLALWSGDGADHGTVTQAWSAVRAIGKGLAGEPWRARLRAAFDVRSLRAVPGTGTR
ncbi:transglutaminaseTgpA domain-containing protein [Amycolatopsis sp. NPDC048633]|uniref:transglutaminase TgpA family protein n=1 Tax=Amycolatopsis sp. NPDC048633 TaxID=3157095 RepID=UPI0033F33F3B